MHVIPTCVTTDHRRARLRSAALGVALAAGLLAVPAAARAEDPAAGRKGKPTFEEEEGFTDPRKRQLPRTHRFRLAMESYYIRLSQAQNTDTGESERFHYAPLLLNAGYQAQFLRRLMFRASFGAGGNVANSRNAMPLVFNPRGHFGYQGTWFGLAFNYGYLFNVPRIKDAASGDPGAIGQPIILKTHSLGPELSATTRVDRVALQLSFGLNFTKTDLQHFELRKESWRPTLVFGFGAFFDGSIRRARAKRRAAAD